MKANTENRYSDAEIEAADWQDVALWICGVEKRPSANPARHLERQEGKQVATAPPPEGQ